ncbi:hypothetical protein KM043_010909 [Ampulex compressa]|nr:hypothetical protein KM043_010909 [Ampulex compressa]
MKNASSPHEGSPSRRWNVRCTPSGEFTKEVFPGTRFRPVTGGGTPARGFLGTILELFLKARGRDSTPWRFASALSMRYARRGRENSKDILAFVVSGTCGKTLTPCGTHLSQEMAGTVYKSTSLRSASERETAVLQ